MKTENIRFKQMPSIIKIGLIQLLTLLHVCALAQVENGSLTKNIRLEVINSFFEQLGEHYVIQPKIESIKRGIEENLNNGAYDSLDTYEKFAKELTSHIKSLSNDLHFLIFYTGNPPRLSALPPQKLKKPTLQLLEGDIAYLTNILKLSTADKKLFEQLMEQTLGHKAVILDLRKCSGGDNDIIRIISSYIFPKPVHLISYQGTDGKLKKVMTQRKKSQFQEGSVFLLTSKSTASGGEALAYILKHHGKAMIIGEKTMGAAHTVATFDLSYKYRAFIPISRPVHPKTNGNWEGIGVMPDYPVAADNALEHALELLQR
jgi:hypothetical protein